MFNINVLYILVHGGTTLATVVTRTRDNITPTTLNDFRSCFFFFPFSAIGKKVQTPSAKSLLWRYLVDVFPNPPCSLCVCVQPTPPPCLGVSRPGKSSQVVCYPISRVLSIVPVHVARYKYSVYTAYAYDTAER